VNAPFVVDRLWPDPAAGLDLDTIVDGLELPHPPDRPVVGVNMVTSIDGRAQLAGTAEGLSGRADRRLMQLYRAAYDAVAAGVGTLRADDFHSRLAANLAERRGAAGHGPQPQPVAVLIAGSRPLPTDRRWFAPQAGQRRIAVVGDASPHAAVPLPRVETWVAPGAVPDPAWLLDRLAAEGVRSVLLEGGPTINAAFLAADLVDELYWTIGARLVGGVALSMVAPTPVTAPREARLLSIHRAGDELFLRYVLAAAGAASG
jgi:5-amino-6-(5-phosphoribosylamino)uracil reductase